MSKPTISRVTAPQIPRDLGFEKKVVIEIPDTTTKPSGFASKTIALESLPASAINLKAALNAVAYHSSVFYLMKNEIRSDTIDQISLSKDGQGYGCNTFTSKKDYSGPSM